jgi:hypothetical protein
VQKLDYLECQIGQSDFPESGQQFCSKELIYQAIQDSTMTKFIRSGSLLAGLSSGALLPGQTTNDWAMGASADDVSTLDGVIQHVEKVKV